MPAPKEIRVPDMQLGDTIALFDGAFGTAIVTQIKDGRITLFRPYATTANFAYSGGAIPYIGMETIELFDYSLHVYPLLGRKELR